MKSFYIQYNIGKAKYTVNYCNEIKQHADGSEFYDIKIFKNKKKMNQFINTLKHSGYIERNKL